MNNTYDLPYDVSSSDFEPIISAWLAQIEADSDERREIRDWRNANTVQWLLNQTGTKALAVYRHHELIVDSANKNYINSGVVMSNVYSVVHRSYIERGDSITLQNKVLATIGQDSENDEFYLLSNAKKTMKKRTNGGADMHTLECAIACIAKAIKLATNHGQYDNSTMHKIDEMVKPYERNTASVVRRQVINFPQNTQAIEQAGD